MTDSNDAEKPKDVPPPKRGVRAVLSKRWAKLVLACLALACLGVGGFLVHERDRSLEACDVTCACMGCPQDQRDKCKDHSRQAWLAANARDCRREFNAVVRCTLAKSKCVDRQFVPGHCRAEADAVRACAGRVEKIYY